jgi:uncharacterized protein YrrD
MRLKELRGLPVIDPTAARKVGTVTNYQVDPAAGRVAALDINPVDPSDGERILGHRIRRVGRHAVVLVGRAASASNATLEQNDTWIDPAALEGLEVLGDDGDRIGHLMDASFDQNSLEIEAYLLNATFWQRLTGRHGRIQPTQVHSCSRELMIVTTGRMVEPAPDTDADADTTAIGVPLKVEDRLPEPDKSPVENGQRVTARVE